MVHLKKVKIKKLEDFLIYASNNCAGKYYFVGLGLLVSSNYLSQLLLTASQRMVLSVSLSLSFPVVLIYK